VAFCVTWDTLNLATAPDRQSNWKPAEPISEAVRFREHDPLKRRVLPRPAHVITLFQPLVRDPRYDRVPGNHWAEGGGKVPLRLHLVDSCLVVYLSSVV
jgi:hypothetical protein